MAMIPLGDASRRPTRFPAVTSTIIAINVVVFFVELAGGDAFVLRWSMVPAQIATGNGWITVLTSMFMHASWSHIIGNMVFLWAFGPEIEDAMGGRRYTIFYLLGGIAASLSQLAVDPHSTVPNLGASGAIAAVMGAFLVTYPRDRIRSLLFFGIFFRITYIPAMLLIGFWFVTQLFSAGAIVEAPTTASQSGGVAYLAHIGGLTFGAIFARLFEIRERVTADA